MENDCAAFQRTSPVAASNETYNLVWTYESEPNLPAVLPFDDYTGNVNTYFKESLATYATRKSDVDCRFVYK